MRTGWRVAVATVALAMAGRSSTTAVGPAVIEHGSWLQARLAAASPGAIIDVPAGRYTGPFTVSQPVTLRGHGRAVLVGNGQTHVVAVRAADVTIEGFAIQGSGRDLALDQAGVHVTGARAVIRNNHITETLHGVYIRQADQARIEDNTIVGQSQTWEPVDPGAKGLSPADAELCAVTVNQNRRGNGVHIWNSTGHVITRNIIRDTRDGIYFSFVDESVIRSNDIANVRYGLHYMYSDGNTFEDNVFHDNAAGAALMYSKGLTLRRNRFVANRSHRAYGLLLQSVDETLITENEISGNTLGLFLENSYANRVLENRIARNHIGLQVSDSSDANVFAGNRFTDNVHPVETTGNNEANRWSQHGRGNAWDGASRLDLDGNGIADLPHRELDLFGQLRRSLPAIGLLAGSPGERLLRFVHARLGLPGVAGIVDPSPLVTGASR